MSDRIQCDDCGKSTIFDDDASYRCKACCSQAYRDHHELYVAARADFARQARTIRRLFTAYFLAKAKLRTQRDINNIANEAHDRGLGQGSRSTMRWLIRKLRDTGPHSYIGYTPPEIAAALENDIAHDDAIDPTDKGIQGAHAAEERARIVAVLRDLDLISEYGAVPSLLADAIERGDL